MLRFMPMLKLDKVDEGAAGGGGFPQPPKVDTPPKEDSPPAEAKGDNLDELGYEKLPAVEGDKKEAGDSKEEKADESKTPEKVETPGTGYGDEPPKVEEPAVEVKKEEVPPATEIDKALEGLPKEEHSKIKEFIAKHKVSDEVTKAFVDMRKQELQDAIDHGKKVEKELEQERIRQRATWHKELKEDPAFGGEKFTKSVAQVEKVLEEFMPSTKKRLTETKGMLPPWVMRDLAKLADHLYSTEKLVHGDPQAKVEKVEEDDGTGFYQ